MDGKLKLLGLIARVGATDVKDIDESFEDFTRRMDTVELHLDMHKALPHLPGMVNSHATCTHISIMTHR